MCRSGRIDSAIETVKTALRARRDAVVTALERELPEARFNPPQGGYFIYAEATDGVQSVGRYSAVPVQVVPVPPTPTGFRIVK